MNFYFCFWVTTIYCGMRINFVHSFCETQLKKNVAESSLRWNFDFVSGQPIRSPDSKYIWERVPPLSGDDSASVLDNGGPMMTLSSAAHIRTIQVIAAGLVSPPGSSSPSSSATSSVTSSPSTSICSVDLEEEQQQQEVVAKGNSSNSAFGDLSGAAGEASNDGVAKRMVQKKMTGKRKYIHISFRGNWGGRPAGIPGTTDSFWSIDE